MLGTKIAELEKRIQTMSNLEITPSSPIEYSPSQHLLDAYCAADVDLTDVKSDKDNESDTPRNSCTKSQDVVDNVNKSPSEIDSNINSDDGMSSYTSESAQSIMSSVYDVDLGLGDCTKSASFNDQTPKTTGTKDTPSITDSGNYSSTLLTGRTNGSASSYPTEFVSHEIQQQRINDLKDLPPELAEMVLKALHELDIREYENSVVCDQNSIHMETLEEESRS